VRQKACYPQAGGFAFQNRAGEECRAGSWPPRAVAAFIAANGSNSIVVKKHAPSLHVNT